MSIQQAQSGANTQQCRRSTPSTYTRQSTPAPPPSFAASPPPQESLFSPPKAEGLRDPARSPSAAWPVPIGVAGSTFSTLQLERAWGRGWGPATPQGRLEAGCCSLPQQPCVEGRAVVATSAPHPPAMPPHHCRGGGAGELLSVAIGLPDAGRCGERATHTLRPRRHVYACVPRALFLQRQPCACRPPCERTQQGMLQLV